jgi:hypothetical protein
VGDPITHGAVRSGCDPRLSRKCLYRPAPSQGRIGRAADPCLRQHRNQHGILHFSYVKDGETKTIPARYSFMYVKDGDQWLIADHHSSAISSAPPR